MQLVELLDSEDPRERDYLKTILQFLVRALIPLHKPKCISLYHQQLSYCIIQYVEKDADTATPIFDVAFKFEFPITVHRSTLLTFPSHKQFQYVSFVTTLIPAYCNKLVVASSDLILSSPSHVLKQQAHFRMCRLTFR